MSRGEAELLCDSGSANSFSAACGPEQVPRGVERGCHKSGVNRGYEARGREVAHDDDCKHARIDLAQRL